MSRIVDLTGEENRIVELFMKNRSNKFMGEEWETALQGVLTYFLSKAHDLSWFVGGQYFLWTLVRSTEGWTLEGVPGEHSKLNDPSPENLWYMLRTIWEAARSVEEYH